jgi:hypothetical protein
MFPQRMAAGWASTLKLGILFWYGYNRLKQQAVLENLIVAELLDYTHQGAIVLLVVRDDNLTVVLVSSMQYYPVVFLGILEPPGEQLFHIQ